MATQTVNQTAPEARSGLDPWRIDELPPAPRPRGLQWFNAIGPGVIVLGPMMAAADGGVPGGEYKVLEIGGGEHLDKLVDPVLAWLQDDASASRAAVLYVAPENGADAGPIYDAVRRRIAEKGLSPELLGGRLSILTHDAAEEEYSLARVLDRAFTGASPLRRFSGRITVARTVQNRAWLALPEGGLTVGGLRISAEDIVTFFLNVLADTALPVSLQDAIDGAKLSGQSA